MTFVRAAALFLCAVLILPAAADAAGASRASADRLQKEKARLEEVRRKAQKTASDLAEAISRERTAKGRVEELQGRLARQQRLVARLDRRLAEISARLERTEEEIRRLDAERDAAGRRLAGGATRAFRADKAAGGAALRGARAERARYFARRALAVEASRYGRLSEEREERKERKAGLERSLEESERSRRREATLGRALAERKEAESRRLAEIAREKKRAEKELAALRARIAAMETLVTRIEKQLLKRERKWSAPQGQPPPRFASVSGGLVAPLAGKVVGRFGARRDPVFDVVLENRGIEIEAPSGAIVRAVGKGEVVFLGTVEGFGKVLILRHGSGLFSVYGKAESFTVRHGQTVAAGEPVGRLPAGPDGKSVLYLEFRAGGTAIDPLTVISIPRG